MRSIAIAVLATTLLLCGCAAAVVEGGLAEGALEAGAGEAGIAAGAGYAEAAAVAPIEVSSDLEGLASQQGVLSNWLGDFARQGKTAYLEQGGILRANGQRIASIDGNTGAIWSRNGTKVGYIGDGYIFEYVRGSLPKTVGVLEGWVPRNGVQLTTSLYGTTSVEVLRPNVVVRVAAIGNGQYLVRLPNGATGWLPASSLMLMILAVGQQNTYCPDGVPGALIRKSGEEVLFRRCRQVDGAFILDTPAGVVVVDSLDVDSVLTGDRVPGIDQMVYAENEIPAQLEFPGVDLASVNQTANDIVAGPTSDANAASNLPWSATTNSDDTDEPQKADASEASNWPSSTTTATDSSTSTDEAASEPTADGRYDGAY